MERNRVFNPDLYTGISSTNPNLDETRCTLKFGEDNIQNVVFCPDPATGFPSSDIAIDVRMLNDPNFVDFVRDRVQSPLPHRFGVDDEETAFEMTRGRDESTDDYVERVRKITKEKYLKDEETEDE